MLERNMMKSYCGEKYLFFRCTESNEKQEESSSGSYESLQ